jgi:hypothetical protein
MNPQLESRDYNNMNTNGDGDDGAMIDDGDDTQSSFDPDGGEDQCPSTSSPSSSLLEVRFLQVLVSTNVGSLIRLHRVKVFDQVWPVGPYSRAASVPVIVKASVARLFDWLPPKCKNNCI